MKRKLKMEVVLAIMMTVAISFFKVYVNQSKLVEMGVGPEPAELYLGSGSSSYATVQQIVWEDIQGELRKGSFETVVEGLRNVTSHYRGSVPYSNMLYENELWSGKLGCNVPTENVSSCTFEVRRLINENGKVTHISISIIETKVNQTGPTEEPMSTISIGIKETRNSESPIINQVGAVVPWLVTSLIWIAQGLIIGVPLCFISLGVVIIIDRGIIQCGKTNSKVETWLKQQPKTEPQRRKKLNSMVDRGYHEIALIEAGLDYIGTDIFPFLGCCQEEQIPWFSW